MFGIKKKGNEIIKKDKEEYVGFLMMQIGGGKFTNPFFAFIKKLEERSLDSTIDFLEIYFGIENKEGRYIVNEGLNEKEKENIKRASVFQEVIEV